MPEQGAFSQVDEKHVAVEAELMVWSPQFDLVALSNVQGEVCLIILNRKQQHDFYLIYIKRRSCYGLFIYCRIK